MVSGAFSPGVKHFQVVSVLRMHKLYLQSPVLLGNCDVKENLVDKTDVGDTAKRYWFWVEMYVCGVVASAVVIKLVLCYKRRIWARRYLENRTRTPGRL